MFELKDPNLVSGSIQRMNLNFLFLSAVCRDDLDDHGVANIVETIGKIRKLCPDLPIDFLSGDLNGLDFLVEKIVHSGLNVFSHNIETVERLSSKVRDFRASYEKSLKVLELAKRKNPKIPTKSSIMLGLGEKDLEVKQTLSDLRDVDCNAVWLCQYMRPDPRHVPVDRKISNREFERWKVYATELGFQFVACGLSNTNIKNSNVPLRKIPNEYERRQSRLARLNLIEFKRGQGAHKFCQILQAGEFEKP